MRKMGKLINYVMATPTEKLVFPGRLVAPTTAGVIARQHEMTGVPLEILTRNAIGAGKNKKKTPTKKATAGAGVAGAKEA